MIPASYSPEAVRAAEEARKAAERAAYVEFIKETIIQVKQASGVWPDQCGGKSQ